MELLGPDKMISGQMNCPKVPHYHIYSFKDMIFASMGPTEWKLNVAKCCKIYVLLLEIFSRKLHSTVVRICQLDEMAYLMKSKNIFVWNYFLSIKLHSVFVNNDIFKKLPSKFKSNRFYNIFQCSTFIQ